MSTDIDAKKNSLLAELDAQISDEVRQIDALTKSKERNEALRKALRQSLGVATYDYGSKVKVVQRVIDQLPVAQFTQDDVEEQLKKIDPPLEIDRDRIRAVIWSLAKKHKTIRLVRKGNNREPALFSKLSAPNGVQADMLAKSNEIDRRLNGVSDDNGILTVGLLEDFVREKNRRMKEITERFDVSESTVAKLLHPASKVFVADRGWIKIHE
jgi:hypothetical protein